MKKKKRVPQATMMKRMTTMVETARACARELACENKILRADVHRLEQEFDDRLSEASRKERESWIRSFYDLETRNVVLAAMNAALEKELIELKTQKEIKRREQQ